MDRKSFAWVSAAVLLLLCGWTAATQTPKAPGALRTQKIKGDLFLISGEGGNMASYVTSEGVVLVDDMFDRNHADILAQVKSVTDRPLRYVLNTHQHDDHAGGDAKMLPIAEVIAHKNARANLVAKKQPYYEDTPGTPIGLPRVTFSDETSVFLGGKEVRALHFGRGHTNGDAFVYFPELGVIHTGDMFVAGMGMAIFVDYAQGGSLVEWIKTLDRVLGLDFDTVIPGHGPLVRKADLVKFRNDVETMRTRLSGMVKQGRSRSDIVNTLESEYGWRAKGCPPSPPTGGCLAIQQVDALIAELRQ